MAVIKPGVKCRVIGRADPDKGFDDVIFDGKSPNHGKTVIVVSWQGEGRGELGNIWRCRSDSETPLVHQAGLLATHLDFSERTLEVIPESDATGLRQKAVLAA
jgi:hypothetical protein